MIFYVCLSRRAYQKYFLLFLKFSSNIFNIYWRVSTNSPQDGIKYTIDRLLQKECFLHCFQQLFIVFEHLQTTPIMKAPHWDICRFTIFIRLAWFGTEFGSNLGAIHLFSSRLTSIYWELPQASDLKPLVSSCKYAANRYKKHRYECKNVCLLIVWVRYHKWSFPQI